MFTVVTTRCRPCERFKEPALETAGEVLFCKCLLRRDLRRLVRFAVAERQLLVRIAG
jgi:hypothetical protein